MEIKRSAAALSLLLFLAAGLAGCADKKNLEDINVTKLAQFTDRLGQANVKLYTYSGEVKEENIKAYVEKLGCGMLYAYFYPDTVPMDQIPVEEIGAARSFAEVQEVLYNGEGFARWRYAAQCFAVIPVIMDCFESPASQNCR